MIKNHRVSVFRATPTKYVLFIDGVRAEVNERRVSKTGNKELLMKKGVEIASNMPKRATPYPQKLPRPAVKSTSANGIFLAKMLK